MQDDWNLQSPVAISFVMGFCLFFFLAIFKCTGTKREQNQCIGLVPVQLPLEPALALLPGRRKGFSAAFLCPSSLGPGHKEGGATRKTSQCTLHGL